MLHVQFLFCGMLLSIAVHIHSVFCVPCTVWNNVQQSADTAVLSCKCIAVWDAASLQYTGTDSLVSVHLYHQVQNTRARDNTFCGNIVHFLKKMARKFLA